MIGGGGGLGVWRGGVRGCWGLLSGVEALLRGRVSCAISPGKCMAVLCWASWRRGFGHCSFPDYGVADPVCRAPFPLFPARPLPQVTAKNREKDGEFQGNPRGRGAREGKTARQPPAILACFPRSHDLLAVPGLPGGPQARHLPFPARREARRARWVPEREKGMLVVPSPPCCQGG